MNSDTDDHEVDTTPPVARTMLRAVRSISELRRGIGLTALLVVVAALGRVSIPLLLRSAIDSGFDRKADPGSGATAFASQTVDIGSVVSLAVIGLAVALVSTLAGIVATYRLGVGAERAMAALRRSMTDRILRMSIGQHAMERRGVLVARVTSDVETLSEFFGWGAMAWVMQSMTMLVVGVTMFIVNWKLALVAVVATVPIVWVFVALNRAIVPAHVIVRREVGAYLGGVSELVSTAPVVRGYDAGELLGGRVQAAVQRRRATSKRADLLGALLFISAEAFIVVVLAIVIALGLRWKESAGLTAGTLVSFVFLVREFLSPLMDFSEVQNQTNRAAAGMSRILDLIELPDDVPDPVAPQELPIGPLSLNLAGVGFTYPASETSVGGARPFALSDITLAIGAGEHVAVIGATGSGKSTLAKLLVRAADPTAGSVSIGGVRVTEVSRAELRSRVQWVPQEPFLFNDTIAANVALARPGMSVVEVERLFGELGLESWADRFPEGLQTQVGERGSLLSAGERQLVALARARAGDPDVIVLDEATSSVDATTEAALAHALDKLAEGRTSVVIAHRLTTVARADRVIVVEDGRVAESGAPNELAAVASSRYASYLAAWERSTAS
jgi:ATP-binding cassette, subfamily B, bacterial